MPPKFLFTRAEIIEAALRITRRAGLSGLTARSLAAALGCSVKPIFGLFRNMEQVQQEVRAAADAQYQAAIREAMSDGRYPPYKASGMAYIRFAREEKELFKLLFMCDRSGDPEESGRGRGHGLPVPFGNVAVCPRYRDYAGDLLPGLGRRIYQQGRDGCL